MYFDRILWIILWIILRIWIVDPVNYFLLSVFLGSLLASCLKDYVSEEEAMND